ncbi:MAG: hypothetical protein KDK06_00540 [Gammaproteobacteria bacterium]|nr:hypothetical protein [Planctomycetota bacterium]MCB1745628.1 hypothetical protein [Gammaproteobacteria bacterium]
MAARKADWSILRGTIIGFVVCVVVAGSMLAASFYFRDGMQREYQANHRRFRDASRQYLAVDEEERIIDEFYPQFVRLYRGGMLGRERRLSWLETLREAGAVLRVPELNYKLSAQQAWQPDFDLDLGGYTVYASTLDLHLGLLHEGDLLRLLAMLDEHAQGQYTVRRCALRSDGHALELDPAAINVRSECELEWLTLDLAGDQELKL